MEAEVSATSIFAARTSSITGRAMKSNKFLLNPTDCGSIRKTNSFANPAGSKELPVCKRGQKQGQLFLAEAQLTRRYSQTFGVLVRKKREPGELTSPTLFAPFAYRAAAGFSAPPCLCLLANELCGKSKSTLVARVLSASVGRKLFGELPLESPLHFV